MNKILGHERSAKRKLTRKDEKNEFKLQGNESSSSKCNLKASMSYCKQAR